MEYSDDIVTLLKCAVLSRHGFKPTKRVVTEFLSSVTYCNRDINSLITQFLDHMQLKSRNTCTPLDQIDKMRSTFLAFDTKGRGFIGREDLYSITQLVLPSFTQSQVNSIFRQLDCDGDGCITFKDFEKIMLFSPGTV